MKTQKTFISLRSLSTLQNQNPFPLPYFTSMAWNPWMLHHITCMIPLYLEIWKKKIQNQSYFPLISLLYCKILVLESTLPPPPQDKHISLVCYFNFSLPDNIKKTCVFLYLKSWFFNKLCLKIYWFHEKHLLTSKFYI